LEGFLLVPDIAWKFLQQLWTVCPVADTHFNQSPVFFIKWHNRTCESASFPLSEKLRNKVSKYEVK